VLEIGNVLSHYDKSLAHAVVDRYERLSRDNAFAEDAETFAQSPPYDLIVSISTFEHVGHDDVPRDEEKILRTMLHLRSLLSPHGSLVFTAPIGYSPSLDRLIDDGDGFLDRFCLRRVNARNEWVEADWSDVRETSFHHPYPFANAIVIARVRPL
jgi:cyclopropane fatty-acyl-phospholipid synthase-like methyltransferase